MRPIALADLEVAVRALLAVPETARTETATALLRAAEMADEYRAESGEVHPIFGNGTLMSAALHYKLAPRPAAYCAKEIATFTILLNAIAARGNNHDN